MVAENDEERLGFDKLLQQLRLVVEELEEGKLGLEEALASYERGVGLARKGHRILEGAEQRVELLIEERNGELSTQPLDDETDSS